VIINHLFDNLPICIINGYYPELSNNLFDTHFNFFDIDNLCDLKQSKNDLPNNYLKTKQQPANTGIHHLLTK
jgi:hypothetical protein